MGRVDSYYFALNPRVVESVDALWVSVLLQVGHSHYTRIDNETGALPTGAEGNVQLSPVKSYSMSGCPGDDILFCVNGTAAPQFVKLYTLGSAVVGS